MQCPSTKQICIGLIIFFVGGISYGGLNIFFDYTNRTEFCTSCHSMKKNYEEYRKSTHFKNSSGVQASCADCHVSKEFFPKLYAKLVAAKDVYHEIIGTVDTDEKFEARRWGMANLVWSRMRENDSRECRTCHSYDDMDLEKQDEMARKKHEKAPMKDKTCIDCHAGLTHSEPLEPE
jgi:cytochrome c-type protein NapC